MNYFLLFLSLTYCILLNAQNSIVHTIDIDPDKKELNEKIEISTNVEYLFKIDKDLKGKTVSISPTNYQKIEGEEFDFLLFDEPKIEVVYSEKISVNNFRVSDYEVKTVSMDFNYNYLSSNSSVDYDSTTNNTISSFIEMAGDYEIVNYRFNPDIGSRKLNGNKIELKGNVNKMHVEIDYILRKEKPKIPVLKKEIIVQKEVSFKGTLTLSVWDDVQEDGDIISLWLGEVCFAKNLKVSKEKVNYKITKEMFGASNTLNIRIDNVDEGTVPPNTVLVELRGDGVNENMRINTTSNMSKEIVLKK